MNTNTQPQGEILLTWTAPVTPEPVRSKAWYVIAIIAALLMLFYSIKTGAWTFTGVLVLGIGLYIFAHRREQPEKIVAEIFFSLSDQKILERQQDDTAQGQRKQQGGDYVIKLELFLLLPGPLQTGAHVEKNKYQVDDVIDPYDLERLVASDCKSPLEYLYTLLEGRKRFHRRE